jgi:hypothetical protein
MPLDNLTNKIFLTRDKFFCGVEGRQQWPWTVIHAVAETIDGFVMDKQTIAATGFFRHFFVCLSSSHSFKIEVFRNNLLTTPSLSRDFDFFDAFCNVLTKHRRVRC